MSDDPSLLLEGLWARYLEAMESGSRDGLVETLGSILLLVGTLAGARLLCLDKV